jgi:hypothetical protein
LEVFIIGITGKRPGDLTDLENGRYRSQISTKKCWDLSIKDAKLRFKNELKENYRKIRKYSV